MCFCNIDGKIKSCNDFMKLPKVYLRDLIGERLKFLPPHQATGYFGIFTTVHRAVAPHFRFKKDLILYLNSSTFIKKMIYLVGSAYPVEAQRAKSETESEDQSAPLDGSWYMCCSVHRCLQKNTPILNQLIPFKII
jgi:hypothetical protein